MKNTAKYPSHFFALLEVKLPLSIHFNNWREAHSTFSDINGFAEALRTDGHPGAKIIEAMSFNVIIDKDGSHGATLIISQTNDPLRAALTAASAATSPPTSPTAIEEKK